MVTQSEKAVLDEIYRNSRLGLSAIQTMMGKVYDDELALDLNRQAVKLSKLEEKAVAKMYEKGLQPETIKPMEKMKLWSSIQGNTLLNTSTEHVANMMIRENSQGMTKILKAMKHNRAATKESYELAEEFMDFSERSISQLKSYLK